jgi:hypothetical protein
MAGAISKLIKSVKCAREEAAREVAAAREEAAREVAAAREEAAVAAADREEACAARRKAAADREEACAERRKAVADREEAQVAIGEAYAARRKAQVANDDAAAAKIMKEKYEADRREAVAQAEEAVRKEVVAARRKAEMEIKATIEKIMMERIEREKVEKKKEIQSTLDGVADAHGLLDALMGIDWDLVDFKCVDRLLYKHNVSSDGLRTLIQQHCKNLGDADKSSIKYYDFAQFDINALSALKNPDASVFKHFVEKFGISPSQFLGYCKIFNRSVNIKYIIMHAPFDTFVWLIYPYLDSLKNEYCHEKEDFNYRWERYIKIIELRTFALEHDKYDIATKLMAIGLDENCDFGIMAVIDKRTPVANSHWVKLCMHGIYLYNDSVLSICCHNNIKEIKCILDKLRISDEFLHRLDSDTYSHWYRVSEDVYNANKVLLRKKINGLI